MAQKNVNNRGEKLRNLCEEVFSYFSALGVLLQSLLLIHLPYETIRDIRRAVAVLNLFSLPEMESRSKETESDNEASAENYEPDVKFEPVISLPLVNHVTLEEDESTLIKLRARLYRYDNEESPPMWKERGTGDIKILHHKYKNTARIVMRRDKTLKICANHFIIPSMELSKPSSKKKNWWIWTVPSDFADEIARSEIFAIKFSNEENANLWKQKFKEAQEIIQDESYSSSNKENEENISSSESSVEGSPSIKKEPKEEEEKVSLSMNQLSLNK